MSDPDDERRFSFGPAMHSPPELAGVTFGGDSVFIEETEENRPLLAYFAVWSWLRWVASGSRMLRVAHVDAENGIITMESA